MKATRNARITNDSINAKDKISGVNNLSDAAGLRAMPSRAAAAASPFVEALKKKDIEVIYMVDPIDEYVIQQLKDFDGYKLKNCSKEGLDLEQTEE